MANVAWPTWGSVDVVWGGSDKITGTTTRLGVVGAYKVRLFDRTSALLIRETWSASDGTYTFPNIKYQTQGYFTVAHDHGSNQLNAAIADLLSTTT